MASTKIRTQLAVGQRFGRLTFTGAERQYRTPSGQPCRQVLCRCDCGVERFILLSSLTTGRSASCGCKGVAPIKPGDQVGRWTVLEEGDYTAAPSGKLWKRRLCRCACGTERFLIEATLRRKATLSCGCYRDEASAKRRYRHGDGKKGQENPVYRTWLSIRQRCENPNDGAFRYYGARGIKMHPAWVADYKQFLKDMGQRPSPAHSIDRIDVNGDYEPDNCRWATKSEQMRNRTCNRMVEFRGRVMPLIEAVELAGANYATAHNRIVYKGWSVEDALSRPSTKPPVPKRRSAPLLTAAVGHRYEGLGKHTDSDIRRIFAAQRGRCAYCREKLTVQVVKDHAKPIAQGGRNEAKNIQLTCFSCNASKGSMSPEAYARKIGLLI